MARTDPLLRLLHVLESSPAMYISQSGIWSYPGAEALKLALADLVDDQKSLATRAGTILEDRGATLPRVAFPLSYTAWHDLDVSYLMPRVLDRLRAQAAECETLVATAGNDAAAADLAAEAMHSARRHLAGLEQVVARHRAGPEAAGSAAPSAAP